MASSRRLVSHPSARSTVRAPAPPRRRARRRGRGRAAPRRRRAARPGPRRGPAAPGRDAGSDAVDERRVLRRGTTPPPSITSTSAAQQAQAAQGRGDHHRHDLVGQRARRCRAATSSPARAAPSTSGGSSSTSLAGDHAQRDPLEHRPRAAHAEVGGHGPLEHGVRAAAVAAAHAAPSPISPIPAAAGGARELAHRREAHRAPVRADARAVDARRRTRRPTPQPRSVPARSTAKVSLRPARPVHAGGRAATRSEAAVVGPAGRRPPGEGADVGDRAVVRGDAGLAQGGLDRRPQRPTTPPRPTSSCEQVGPRAVPSTSPFAVTSATSVFEPPPSTASTAARGPRLLTLGHLGGERVVRRDRGRGGGRGPGEELGRDHGHGRRQAVAERAERDAGAPGSAASSGPTTSTRAPARRSSSAIPRSRARVAAEVENTTAAISGPASSSGPCRNCAACSDSAGKRAASLSVSAAHLGRRPRPAARRAGRARAGRPASPPAPARRARRSASSRSASSAAAAAPSCGRRLLPSARGDRGHQHERRGERHRRGPVLLAAPRVEVDVRRGRRAGCPRRS